MSESAFEGWAIVELMGHRTRPGFVKEVEIAGGKMLRIDIPAPDGDVTEFYGTSAIYSIRPCSEQMARDQSSNANSRPVRPIQYRELEPPRERENSDSYAANRMDAADVGEDEEEPF